MWIWKLWFCIKILTRRVSASSGYWWWVRWWWWDSGRTRAAPAGPASPTTLGAADPAGWRSCRNTCGRPDASAGWPIAVCDDRGTSAGDWRPATWWYIEVGGWVVGWWAGLGFDKVPFDFPFDISIRFVFVWLVMLSGRHLMDDGGGQPMGGGQKILYWDLWRHTHTHTHTNTHSTILSVTSSQQCCLFYTYNII